MTATLKVENLCKTFDKVKVIDDISFSAAAGVVGFLGPNGAGKSTTMKMITGFLSPSAGKIYVGGYDISEQAVESKRLIGYLPEGAPSYSEMTVIEFIKFIADVHNIPRSNRVKQVNDTIDKLNLSDVRRKKIESLSKGYKRRVGLAAALVHDPAVLILDEPTDGLDPNQKREIRSLINGMAQDKTIILSTHILEEVTACCDRVIVLANGKIILDSTPDELVKMAPTKTAVGVLDEVFVKISGKERETA